VLMLGMIPFRLGYHAFAPASPLVSILAAKKGKGG